MAAAKTQFRELLDRLDAIHDSLRDVDGRLDATRKWYIFDRYGKKVSEGFNSQAEAERSQRRDFDPDERTYVRQDDAIEYDPVMGKGQYRTRPDATLSDAERRVLQRAKEIGQVMGGMRNTKDKLVARGLLVENERGFLVLSEQGKAALDS